MEDGRPVELTMYKWWAEGEQRGCHTTTVEEAGAGRWADILETPGFQGWCVLLTHTKLGLPGRGARLTGDSGTKYFSKQDLETGTLSELDGGTGDLSWAKLRNGCRGWVWLCRRTTQKNSELAELNRIIQ